MTVRILLCAMTLASATASHAAPLLSIDFNCRTNTGAAQTQPGFSSFLITSIGSDSSAQTNATIRTFGTYRVTLWGNGMNKGYTDRWRPLPTNQAAFTESQLLRDCVYSPDPTTNGGLNVLIENLPPTNRLQVTVWSFDAASIPVPVSDWYANGVLVRHGYRFTNSVLPFHNEQYRFSFTAMVNAAGQLLIEGRRNELSISDFGTRIPGVFLNALQIDPEPLEILSIAAVGDEVRITFVVRPQPGDYIVEEAAGDAWQWTSGVVYSAAGENRVTARFPKPTQTRLYRIRYGY